MDTSKEYIKMCEKATEVQEIGLRWCKELIEKCKLGYFYNTFDLDGGVWLPRQDQLQEMLKDKFSWRNLYAYYDKMKEYARVSFLGATQTHEQLLLQIVMLEKYNKKWNGEEWV